MPAVSIYIEVVGLDAMQKSFGDLENLGFKAIGRFEKTFAATFTAVENKVHVLTGDLKASGLPRTHFDGDTWTGEIDYDRYPGIFELARGDSPTLNHPEGGHNFFDAVDAFIAQYDDDVDAVFRDAFETTAPI